MVNTTQAAFNHQRGGTDAASAPLAVIMRQPGLEAVNGRMVRRFSGAATPSPLSLLLGAPLAGPESWWPPEQPWAGRREPGPVSPLAGAGPDSSSVRWLARGDGGWEAAADGNGIWVAPAYGFLRHRGDRDYTIRGYGVTLGLDRYVSDNLYLGLALSLDYPRYESDDADVNAWGAASIFYGGLTLPWALELGFSASLGGMNFEQARTVNQDRYHSDYDAQIISMGASLGRRFALGENFILRPFADWHYFFTNIGAHSERADVYSLSVQASRNNLYRIQAGLEGGWAGESGSIGAKVYWSGLRGDTQDAAAAHFVLDPDANRFNAPLEGLDKDSLGLGLNAGLRLGANTELRLEYSLLYGETTTAHQGMIGLRWEF
jgi:uncharacterized protein with beta-barrel porin domain